MLGHQRALYKVCLAAKSSKRWKTSESSSSWQGWWSMVLQHRHSRAEKEHGTCWNHQHPPTRNVMQKMFLIHEIGASHFVASPWDAKRRWNEACWHDRALLALEEMNGTDVCSNKLIIVNIWYEPTRHLCHPIPNINNKTTARKNR